MDPNNSDQPVTAKPIRIVVADDHPIFRRGLKVVIESDPELQVIAEADDGVAALELIEQLSPDIAVLDVDMPRADGLAVVRGIHEKNLRTPAVFLTMHKDEAIFDAAVGAGVKGFVIKDSAATDIINCIKAVVSGQSFFSSAVADFLLQSRKQNAWRDDLTASELRVLRLVAEGRTSREIGEELFISPRTVEHHRANIAAKLELKGKNGLLTFALLHQAEIQRG